MILFHNSCKLKTTGPKPYQRTGDLNKDSDTLGDSVSRSSRDRWRPCFCNPISYQSLCTQYFLSVLVYKNCQPKASTFCHGRQSHCLCFLKKPSNDNFQIRKNMKILLFSLIVTQIRSYVLNFYFMWQNRTYIIEVTIFLIACTSFHSHGNDSRYL